MFGGGDGNLSDSSNTLSNLSSTSSAGQDPKTHEILRLREENYQLKRRLRDIIGDSDDDDGDARKNWSDFSKKRKKQLLGKISTQMSKLAGERGTGVVNIATSLIARFQI